MFKIQYFLFRAFNKIKLSYKVIYFKREEKNIYNIINFIIKKRVSDVSKYPYYESILNFFKNYNNNNSIKLYDINNEDVFLGSDMRMFNKKMLSKELPSVYYTLFKEMNKGFRKVITDKDNLEKVKNILKFLDIYEYVDIVIK